MYLTIKVWNLPESPYYAELIAFDLLLLADVIPVECYRHEPCVTLVNRLVHQRPSIRVTLFAISTLLAQEVDALQVLLIVDG